MAKYQIKTLETVDRELSFALLAWDRFTGANTLAGETRVSLANHPLRAPFISYQKLPEATFLFFNLQPGNYTVAVQSNQDAGLNKAPAFYLPKEIPVSLPLLSPLWPAFPEVSLADPSLPLDDPNQPAAYRAQRLAAALQPSTAYPFPADATLVRGTVMASNQPLAGASVRRVSDDLVYLTADDGEFVLFFKNLSGIGEAITLRASHDDYPDIDHNIEARRGMTVVANITMAP